MIYTTQRHRFVYDRPDNGSRLDGVMVECTLSITHCLQLNLQLHTIDLVRTCRLSSFCTVAWQLAIFQLTRRIARSLGDSWASCCSAITKSDHCCFVSRLQVYAISHRMFSEEPIHDGNGCVSHNNHYNVFYNAMLKRYNKSRHLLYLEKSYIFKETYRV